MGDPSSNESPSLKDQNQTRLVQSEREEEDETSEATSIAITEEHTADYIGSSFHDENDHTSEHRLSDSASGNCSTQRSREDSEEDEDPLSSTRVSSGGTGPLSINGDMFANQVQKLLHMSKVVNDREFSETISEPSFQETTLWGLTQESWLRSRCITIIQHERFDRVVLAVVTVDLVSIAMSDSPGFYMPTFIIKVLCNFFYVSETVIKAIAVGLFRGEGAYLRDGWNQIDFMVVLSGVLDVVLSPLTDAAWTEIISIGRVLRPLRYVTIVEDLQELVNKFIRSLPLLLNALLLLSFLFLMWGLVGVQLFSGELLKRCKNDETGAFDEFADTLPIQQPNCGIRRCSEGYTCVVSERNPNWGLTSFDNLLVSTLTIYGAVTMEKWSDTMYRLQDSFSYWVWPYFLLLVVFGAFFVINLTLLAIKSQMAEDEAVDEPERQKELKDYWAQAKRTLDRIRHSEEDSIGSMSSPRDSDARLSLKLALQSSESSIGGGIGAVTAVAQRSRNNSTDMNNRSNSNLMIRHSQSSCRRQRISSTLFEQAKDSIVRTMTAGGSAYESLECSLESISLFIWNYGYVIPQRISEKMIRSLAFDNFFMLCIFYNTVLLASEHYGMSQDYIRFLQMSNYTLTGLFLLEMCLKILGLGLRGYISDTFNIFDGVIAVLSLIEIVVQSGSGVFSAARVVRIVRVFRMIRVLRVMKLVRYVESFKRLMFVVKRSLRSIWFISLLLMIFIGIYSMLGMFLFRNKFHFLINEQYNLPKKPRNNFDSLFWSFLTVFQILTLEDWIAIMYDGIRATDSIWSAFYFISFVMIGVYCLLNMFLAIVLQNFEVDQRQRLEERLKKKRMENAMETLGRGKISKLPLTFIPPRDFIPKPPAPPVSATVPPTSASNLAAELSKSPKRFGRFSMIELGGEEHKHHSGNRPRVKSLLLSSNQTNNSNTVVNTELDDKNKPDKNNKNTTTMDQPTHTGGFNSRFRRFSAVIFGNATSLTKVGVDNGFDNQRGERNIRSSSPNHSSSSDKPSDETSSDNMNSEDKMDLFSEGSSLNLNRTRTLAEALHEIDRVEGSWVERTYVKIMDDLKQFNRDHCQCLLMKSILKKIWQYLSENAQRFWDSPLLWIVLTCRKPNSFHADIDDANLPNELWEEDEDDEDDEFDEDDDEGEHYERDPSQSNNSSSSETEGITYPASDIVEQTPRNVHFNNNNHQRPAAVPRLRLQQLSDQKESEQKRRKSDPEPRVRTHTSNSHREWNGDHSRAKRKPKLDKRHKRKSVALTITDGNQRPAVTVQRRRRESLLRKKWQEASEEELETDPSKKSSSDLLTTLGLLKEWRKELRDKEIQSRMANQKVVRRVSTKWRDSLMPGTTSSMTNSQKSTPRYRNNTARKQRIEQQKKEKAKRHWQMVRRYVNVNFVRGYSKLGEIVELILPAVRAGRGDADEHLDLISSGQERDGSLQSSGLSKLSGSSSFNQANNNSFVRQSQHSGLDSEMSSTSRGLQSRRNHNNNNNNRNTPVSKQLTRVLFKTDWGYQPGSYSNHIFSHHRWYRILKRIVMGEQFASVILILIILSSIVLAMDSPNASNSVYYPILPPLRWFFVIVFTIEMALKILVMGLYCKNSLPYNDAYLNDSWNRLDGFIVITSLINVFVSDSGSGILGALKVLRAFRPLRIAARSEDLKVVLLALFRSIPAMINVLAVLVLVWLIFGILAVQLFGGKFYRCTPETLYQNLDMQDCLNLRKQEILENGNSEIEWKNAPEHFDDIFTSMRSLFIISTLEGWHIIMYDAMDTTDVGKHPIKNNTSYYAVFFIIFILIGSFFLISLFVGVIFDNFVKLRDEVMGVALLTKKQKHWVHLQMDVAKATPQPLPLPPSLRNLRQSSSSLSLKKSISPMSRTITGGFSTRRNSATSSTLAAANVTSSANIPPGLVRSNTIIPSAMGSHRSIGNNNKMIDLSEINEDELETWEGKMYYLAMSKSFETFVMLCICLNIFVMCLSYEGQSKSYTRGLEFTNLIFSIFFLIEMLIKLIGFGFKQYFFIDPWNRFDFIIVMGSVVEFILETFMGSNAAAGNITLLRVMRLFRVSRLVRIIKSAQRLKALLQTLIISLPSLASVGALLALMYFVYAILAMNLFGTVQFKPGHCIDKNANFRNFFNSFLTMFRVSTGEDWYCIMEDACNEDLGGFTGCWVFFFLFYLTVSFVAINLFIAIILDNFTSVSMPNKQQQQNGGNGGGNGNGGSSSSSTTTLNKNGVTSGEGGGDDTQRSLMNADYNNNNKQGITQDHIHLFIDAWSQFDPLATEYMPATHFVSFITKLPKPMGVGPFGSLVDVFKLLRNCEITVHRNSTVNFTEVLYNLCERVHGCQLTSECKVLTKIHRKLIRKLGTFDEDSPNLGVLLAVLRAQQFFRQRMENKRMKELQKREELSKEGEGRTPLLQSSEELTKKHDDWNESSMEVTTTVLNDTDRREYDHSNKNNNNNNNNNDKNSNKDDFGGQKKNPEC